jgi:glycosyltransferase involved in cell wall biosynthesis
MKILLLCNKAPYPPNDGSSIAIYSMAEGLLEAGANITVWALNTKKHFKDDSNVPDIIWKNWNYFTFFADTTPSVPGALKNLFFSNESYFSERFFIREFNQKLIEKIKQEKFDIIQLEGLFMGNYLPAIRNYSKSLISYRAHNVEFKIWERMMRNSQNPLKKIYLGIQTQRLKKFEKKVLDGIDLLVPITDTDEKNIRIAFKFYKPSIPIPTGLWNEQFKLLPVKTKPFTLFFFGAMDWMPNVEAARWLAEDIFPEIRRKIPDALCILAGRFMPTALKKLKNRKGLVLMEEVKNNLEFYENGTIMAVPLLSGSGLKIKMLEGMALGKCIITTSIGAEGIHGSHGLHYFIADRKEDFISIVHYLYENPDIITKVGANARKFVTEHYDTKILGKRLVDFYTQILNNKSK